MHSTSLGSLFHLRFGLLIVSAVAQLASSCLGQSAVDSGSGLIGTQLGDSPASEFALVNQFEEPVALSDLRGKAVAVTFLYTSCPDTCPVIVGKFGYVHEQLRERAESAAFVVVTVDPERDTPARLRQYLDAQNLSEEITFLTGERAALEKVWSAYHILVSRAQQKQSAYSIVHNDVVYLVDKAGRLRALMHADFAPADLLKNLERLIAE